MLASTTRFTFSSRVSLLTCSQVFCSRQSFSVPLHFWIFISGSLRRLVGPLVFPFKSSMKKAGKYIGPTVEDRLSKEKQYGRDYPERPVGVTP